MHLKKYEIILRRLDGRLIAGTVAHDFSTEDKRLFLEFEDEKLSAEGTDYFQAFCSLRQLHLEGRGILPCCYAASIDVWPSAMSSQMGAGLKAYKSELGVPGGVMVDIFSTGDDINPASVQEQRAFHEAWFKSLGISQVPIATQKSFEPARRLWNWLSSLLVHSKVHR